MNPNSGQKTTWARFSVFRIFYARRTLLWAYMRFYLQKRSSTFTTNANFELKITIAYEILGEKSRRI